MSNLDQRLLLRAERLKRFSSIYQSRLERTYNMRLAIAGLFIFFLILATLTPQLRMELAILILGPSLFIALVIRSQKLQSHIKKINTLSSFYQRQHLRRLGQPQATDFAVSPSIEELDHPLQRDLDLIGPHSLFHLIDETFTHSGGRKLIARLLRPSLNETSIKRIHTETRTVAQWPGALRRLVVEGHTHNLTLGASSLASILRNPLVGPTFYRDRFILNSLFAAYIISLVINQLGYNKWPTVWIYLVFALFSLARLQQTAKSFNRGQDFALALEPWSIIFSRLETLSLQKHWPKDLLKTIAQQKPSQYFRKMNRWLSFLSIQSHPLVLILFNMILPWNFHFSALLESERKKLTTNIETILDELHEFEVLQSFIFVYLYQKVHHPIFTAPEKMNLAEIYHPLIPRDQSVANSFRWGKDQRIAVITGSNMSGKSTFLRSIGLHQVMALAGAPVYAHRATHCPLLPVVSCLRVADSVRKGYSSFYAEVASVKTILDRAKEGTILFLIDEIFRGTNNRERLIGSYSVLQEVIKTDSYGFISTHDLELTQLAKNPEVGNWHFREDIVNNSMVFRYELLAGPCPTTNALKVMELVGLPIHQPNFVQT